MICCGVRDARRNGRVRAKVVEGKMPLSDVCRCCLGTRRTGVTGRSGGSNRRFDMAFKTAAKFHLAAVLKKRRRESP